MASNACVNASKRLWVVRINLGAHYSPQCFAGGSLRLSAVGAGAKNLAEAIELQAACWRKQFDALAAQAEEVRSLSTQLAADAVKPAKEQLTRSMDKLRKAG